MQQSFPTPVPSHTPHWKIWHTLGLLMIIAVIVLLGLMIPTPLRFWSWLGTLLLLATCTCIISHGVTSFWRGALIDERNRISLSRLQLALWTLLILSAFLSAALFNLRNGEADPLLIALPVGIWVLLGISATSLVSTPLIYSYNKQNRNVSAEQVPHTMDQLSKQQVDVSTLTTSERLVMNKSPADASWADLFRSEEVGNATQIDLGKLQLFYFTVIVMLVYALALGSLFTSRQSIIHTFPDINEGVLALLGISHASYLTNKVILQSSS